MGDRNKLGVWLVMAVLSGVLYALAYPPIGWRPAILGGVFGLLWLGRKVSPAIGFRLGLLHGFVAYGISLSWLLSMFGAFAALLWCVMAVFHGLFLLFLARASSAGWTGWRWAVFAAVNWSAWEFIRAELFPLKFPWMTLGLAIGPNALLPVIGVYGAGVVVVLAVALALVRRWWPSALLGTAVVLSIHSFRISSADMHRRPRGLSAAAIQLEEMGFDDYVDATRVLPSDVRYVVWPEYAVYHDVRDHARDWEMLRKLCEEKDITLTFGSRDELDGGAWRNIAVTMDATGELGVHQKVHTVHFFDDGIPGGDAKPIRTRHGWVGTPICFDCDYEGVIRNMVKAGAEMLMIPVMDHQSWTARQHEQHGELFRIRAAENGRWMLVCATSGASKVIDPYGGVHESLAAMEQGVLLGDLGTVSGLTLYTRIGWLFPWLVLAGGGAMWLLLLGEALRRQFRNRTASGEDHGSPAG